MKIGRKNNLNGQSFSTFNKIILLSFKIINNTGEELIWKVVKIPKNVEN